MTERIWHIGIDEAGYGPNLGPFVMTLVACRAPALDLWTALKSAVRRSTEDDDGRILVADSKIVHTAGKGLGALEWAVSPFLRFGRCFGDARAQAANFLAGFLEAIAAGCVGELREETWFHGRTALPVEAPDTELAERTGRIREAAAAADVRIGLVRSVVVCTPRFNSLVQRWDSKAAVLGLSLADLIGYCLGLPGKDAFEIVVDKHGGRNTYGALVQNAFGKAMVLAREEGAARSVYEVYGLKRKVRMTFMPRAEEKSFCVALASMISKYVREVLMGEFNQFWQAQVPGLKPTAGYPGDAERYFEAIMPAMTRLGLAKEKVWRLR